MQWEYWVIDLADLGRHQTVEGALSVAGAAGWELVNIIEPHKAVFKRQKAAETAEVERQPLIRTRVPEEKTRMATFLARNERKASDATNRKQG